VEAARPRRGVDPLVVQPAVDHVRAALVVEPAPDRREPVVVRAATLGTRAVPRPERRRLVQEEELREPARPLERRATAPAELEAARDPAPHLVHAPDVALRVVEAAAIAVDEPTRRMGDELTERRDTVLQGHRRPP